MNRDRIAPEGTIWVCGACGKTSKDRYGDPATSWDESCMLNAVLCYDKPANGWMAVPSSPQADAEASDGR